MQRFLASQGRAYLPLQPGDITAQLRREGKLADREGDSQGQRRISGEARRCFLIEDRVLLGEGAGLGNTGRQGVRGLKPGQVPPVPAQESPGEAGQGETGE